MTDFQQAKDWRQIQAILMQDWDPIGVADELNAADEYDSYIPGVFTLLERNASVTDVAMYLDEIAVQRMGFTPHPELCLRAAKNLVKLGVGSH